MISTESTLDLVITAGLVHTMLDGDTPVTAIGVKNGLIVVTGEREDSRRWKTRDTLDFGNHVLTPGLTDSHSHPIMGTEMTAGVDLTSAHSIDEARALLARSAPLVDRGQWQLAWGLDLNVFVGIDARGDIFDSVLGGLPLFIRLFDGHSALANPAALRASGITGRETFDEASTVFVDHNGNPTGYLSEFGAMRLVQNSVPPVSDAEFGQRLMVNLDAMSAAGLTGLHAMDFIGAPVAMLDALEASGELPIRMKFAPWCEPGVSNSRLEELLKLQSNSGRRWAVDGVKMFIDGTIDNGTAWLSEADSLGQSTQSFWPDPARYTTVMHWFDDHGIKTVTHAIGDAGLNHVLNTFATSRRTQQHRVEHIESASPEIVARFSELGIAASLQPTHCTHYTHADETDNWSVRMGPSRVAGGWPSRDLREAGAIVALGSDWPIASFDPRGIIGASQLRRDVGALTDRPRQPTQALTARMALEGYTSHAAAAAGETGIAGVIAAGARADFTILGGDPLTIAADELGGLDIVGTIIDGRPQYRGALYAAS